MIVTICLAVGSWLVMLGSVAAAACWPQPPLRGPGNHRQVRR